MKCVIGLKTTVLFTHAMTKGAGGSKILAREGRAKLGVWGRIFPEK